MCLNDFNEVLKAYENYKQMHTNYTKHYFSYDYMHISMRVNIFFNRMYPTHNVNWKKKHDFNIGLEIIDNTQAFISPSPFKNMFILFIVIKCDLERKNLFLKVRFFYRQLSVIFYL